jgi:circadian clock protein KaiB
MTRSRGPGPKKLVRLYVAGESPNSVLAKRSLQSAVADAKWGDVVVEIIDVLRDPERGLRDRVLATPTLVRVAPPPERRVIGGLRDCGAVLAELGLGAELQ